jgi:hypothetical protein
LHWQLPTNAQGLSSWLDDDSLAAIVKHVGSDELEGLSSRELHSLAEAAFLGLG